MVAPGPRLTPGGRPLALQCLQHIRQQLRRAEALRRGQGLQQQTPPAVHEGGTARGGSLGLAAEVWGGAIFCSRSGCKIGLWFLHRPYPKVEDWSALLVVTSAVLVVTGALLVVTGALLVVTRSLLVVTSALLVVTELRRFTSESRRTGLPQVHPALLGW